MSQSSFVTGIDRKKRPRFHSNPLQSHSLGLGQRGASGRSTHGQSMLRHRKPLALHLSSSGAALKKQRPLVPAVRQAAPQAQEGVRRIADLLLEEAADAEVVVSAEGVQALQLYFEEMSRRGRVNLYDFVDGLREASDVKFFMGKDTFWHFRYQMMRVMEDIPPEAECTWEHLLFIIRSKTHITLEEPAPKPTITLEQYRQRLAELTEQEDYKHPPPIVLPMHARTYADEVAHEMERLERLEAYVPQPDAAISKHVQDRMDHPEEYKIVLPQPSDDEEEQLLMDPLKQAALRDRFRPLDEEDENAVIEALSEGPDDEVLISKFNVDMTREKLACLRPQTWLNDEVINFYMKMLQERDEALCAKRNRRPSYFNNSFFMSKLVDEGGYRYANVRRWTRKVDIFAMDKVFTPVNIGNFHWTLAVIYMTKKRIVFYDSMGGSGDKYLQALKRYLADESQDKKQKAMDLSDWTLQSNGKKIPRQNNSYDCGVFTCAFADFLSDDLPLRFAQSDIAKWRHKIAHAILQGRIEYPSDRL